MPKNIPTGDQLQAEKPYQIRDGFVVIEAEDLHPHSNWRRRMEPKGYSGTSYIEWRGPNRNRSIEGHGGGADSLGVQQGPREEWLVIHLDVPESGGYRVNLRNYHLREDGDNDAWVGVINSDGRVKLPVNRVGDNLRDGPGFSWLDWGVLSFELSEGENILYVGGRSIGFGVDKIAIYRDGDNAAMERALMSR